MGILWMIDKSSETCHMCHMQMEWQHDIRGVSREIHKLFCGGDPIQGPPRVWRIGFRRTHLNSSRMPLRYVCYYTLSDLSQPASTAHENSLPLNEGT
jgi:hypothetical protein